MNTMKFDYKKNQLTVLVILRTLMGWLCLYEGIAKLMNPNWSSAPFLLDSAGWLAGLFESLTRNPDVLQIIDFLNIWGLIAIGVGLMLGFLTRIASIAGIVLLSLYFLSHPPFVGAEYAMPTEGNYLWVNKTLIEIFVFAILLVFPTSDRIGLDRLIFHKSGK
jgi:thiosulfate dehydrogenase [quinone] large subunit